MESIPQIKIEQFGKEELHFLRVEIQNALDIIKLRYKLSELVLQNITFTSSTFTAKINGAIQVADANDFVLNEVNFFALRNELPYNLIGCGFMLDGLIFNIIKIEFRNRKFPIIAKCKENDKTYKFTVLHTKHLLENHRVIDIN
jgi:hypothetical protein